MHGGLSKAELGCVDDLDFRDVNGDDDMSAWDGGLGRKFDSEVVLLRISV